MPDKPYIIEGGLAIDDRGQVSFVNDFSFDQVKRFYIVENFNLNTIRAYHGHKKEAKYVLPLCGSAIVVVNPMISNDNNPISVPKFRAILSARKPQILYIPSGYVNGFKALEPNTKLMFFSTATIEESKSDDYRFPADNWGMEIWKVEHR